VSAITLSLAEARRILGPKFSRPQGGKSGPSCPTEHEEQVAIFQWAEENIRTYPELAYLYAVPNGGYRAWATAKRLREEGVKAGYPDIGLDVARGGHHGLRIELKRKAGSTVQQTQKKWHAWLREQGYAVHVCKGAEAAIAAIQEYLDLPPYHHGSGL